MITDAVYTLLFYVFAVTAIFFALAVVMSRRLLRAAVYLMAVLLVIACFYIMLGAEFLAGIQILVYVGGIVVLIVFAVMLTNSAGLAMDNPPLYRKIIACAASVAFAVMTSWILATSKFQVSGGEVPLSSNNTEEIGLKLLDMGGSGYVLPFEIISILLLAAVIGGIVIARKTPPPEQPFTSGGDLPGEADFTLPKTQRWKNPGKYRI